jgi:hypothetical protein
MWHHSGFLAGCFGGALAVASVLVALEVSATGIGPSERAAPMVDRTFKNDRLPLVPGSRNTLKGPVEPKIAPVAKPELLMGCEPVVSAIGQPPLARVAGRCLS